MMEAKRLCLERARIANFSDRLSSESSDRHEHRRKSLWNRTFDVVVLSGWNVSCYLRRWMAFVHNSCKNDYYLAPVETTGI